MDERLKGRVPCVGKVGRSGRKRGESLSWTSTADLSGHSLLHGSRVVGVRGGLSCVGSARVLVLKKDSAWASCCLECYDGPERRVHGKWMTRPASTQ